MQTAALQSLLCDGIAHLYLLSVSFFMPEYLQHTHHLDSRPTLHHHRRHCPSLDPPHWWHSNGRTAHTSMKMIYRVYARRSSFNGRRQASIIGATVILAVLCIKRPRVWYRRTDRHCWAGVLFSLNPLRALIVQRASLPVSSQFKVNMAAEIYGRLGLPSWIDLPEKSLNTTIKKWAMITNHLTWISWLLLFHQSQDTN